MAEPANLYDNDIPIHTAAAFLFTTAERARDLGRPPVYVLGHASGGMARPAAAYTGFKSRSIIAQPGGIEERATRTGPAVRVLGDHRGRRRLRERLRRVQPVPRVVDRGVQLLRHPAGEALDFFASQDISINGPTPISPSGGNIGSGRTRFWMWTDTIQQLQGRAGSGR